jgi:phosphinothricin acetyltransferase
MSDLVIRPYSPADIPAVTRIYGHYVRDTVITFETSEPDEAEMASRFSTIAGKGHPLLIAEQDGQVIGYAYASTYRPRPAYRFTAEDSIYVHPSQLGRGVVRALLEALLERSAQYGFRTVIAVIGGAEPASIALHEGCGFEEVGRLRRAGFKFGRWLDNMYMQIELPGAGEP